MLAEPDGPALECRQAFERAADAAHRDAAFHLGLILAEPPFLDFPAAMRAFERAADLGHARSAYQLGRLLEGVLHYQAMLLPSELRVEPDPEAARDAYLRAVALGLRRAIWNVAYVTARIRPPDPRAITDAYVAAIRTDPRGLRNAVYGSLCHRPADLESARCLFRAAALTGVLDPVERLLRQSQAFDLEMFLGLVDQVRGEAG